MDSMNMRLSFMDVVLNACKIKELRDRAGLTISTWCDYGVIGYNTQRNIYFVELNIFDNLFWFVDEIPTYEDLKKVISTRIFGVPEYLFKFADESIFKGVVYEKEKGDIYAH